MGKLNRYAVKAKKYWNVPDTAHGTNPATANMAGYHVVNIQSAPNGCVDKAAYHIGIISFVTDLL